MSLEEASGGEKETRWTEVAKGRFGAAVMSGDPGGSAIGYGGDSAGRQTWMGFRVVEEGVEIEGDEVAEVGEECRAIVQIAVVAK